MVNPDPDFWCDRSVFLTGHTGFKGAWLAIWLRHMGARVTGYALEAPNQPSLFDVMGDGIVDQHIHGDVRDIETLARAIKLAAPEVVIHMAAQSLVRPSYDDPVGTYSTNIMGVVNLLESVRLADGVKAVVNVTSDKCYENRNWLWSYREDEPMGGHDPYSSSKGCAELVTASFRSSFFNGRSGQPAVATARAGNVIGGGDWAIDRIIPDCIRAFQAGETLSIRNPAATRPWQHVLDPLCGYLLLAEHLANAEDPSAFAEGWNFGPGENDARPVGEIAERMVALWGDTAAWAHENTPQPHEANHLKIDASKARKRLGWQHRLPIEEALSWTIDWYKRHTDGEDAKALCLEQIKNLEAQYA